MADQIAMTGAGGFLGWHTRVAAQESGRKTAPITLGSSFDSNAALGAVQGSDRLIHLAGVNRGSDQEVEEGNVAFARSIAEVLERAEDGPAVVVYANSIHAGNGTVYGRAKQRSAEILAQAAHRAGAEFVDVQLPNLFGEHGRPFYNSVTATFCHLLAQGETPEVTGDRELTLLHAQNAADALLGDIRVEEMGAFQELESVSGLAHRLHNVAAIYRRGEIPDISSSFNRDLFNTYRSYTFPEQTPIQLTRHADHRGAFCEVVRSHGGPGQSSFSTTAPGVTRGDHFHRRKVERFTVVSGRARISLRRLFDDAVFDFDVDGRAPASVDMPTMWAHNITNTGDDTLLTEFWTNDIFNPDAPDTIPEVV